MTNNKNPDVIADDVVVKMEYRLSVNGKQIGSSKNRKPISFVQGQGEIVPGLEKNLYDMKVGDSKEIKVKASDGYGEIDPDNFATLHRSDFPESIPMEPGIIITLTDEAGDNRKARIDSVSSERVKLNFNHPLAGKELVFQVSILELRAASPEELDPGLL